jgi:hypothetical protein
LLGSLFWATMARSSVNPILQVITINSFAITAGDVFPFEFLILSCLHFLAP